MKLLAESVLALAIQAEKALVWLFCLVLSKAILKKTASSLRKRRWSCVFLPMSKER
jgi:hypothetical protein